MKVKHEENNNNMIRTFGCRMVTEKCIVDIHINLKKQWEGNL